MSFPDLVSEIEKESGHELYLKKEILSVNAVRNCLIHRNGVVSDLDTRNEPDDILRLQFIDLLTFYRKDDKMVEMTWEDKSTLRTDAIQFGIASKVMEIRSGTEIKIDQNIINATIILILISCLVSSFVSEKAARRIAVLEKDVNRKTNDKIERILIPVSNPENIQRLIDFSLLIKDHKSSEAIYPLSIVEDDADADEKLNVVRKVIEGAVEQISSGDKKVEVLKKVDLSIVDGIIRTAKAYNITDILISYKAQRAASNLIFGNISEKPVE